MTSNTMKRYFPVWILFLIICKLFNATELFAHDNAKVHPFTLTGKATEILKDKAGCKM